MTKFCDCDEDGYCNRYGREMRGRFREICRGDNVDIGDAAAFRAQWRMEAPLTGRSSTSDPTEVVLSTNQQPGDSVCMTAAIYSLHTAHPGKYVTSVESYHPEVFYHNPHVVETRSLKSPYLLRMHYPAVHQCNDRGIHFMHSWCEHLSSALGVQVPLLTERPRLYFSTPPSESPLPFWVICSGGKTDLTNKLWGTENYQRVVDSLKGEINFIQVGARESEHPPLRDVINVVGKTNLRGMFNLFRQCRGVLCGVSLPMHVAAALDKPSVVIAGGREPVQWNAYPKQHYLHTVGLLPCKSVQGRVGAACWRSRVLPLRDDSFFDNNPCEMPVDGIPKCMRLIEPKRVAELIYTIDSNLK